MPIPKHDSFDSGAAMHGGKSTSVNGDLTIVLVITDRCQFTFRWMEYDRRALFLRFS